MRTSRNCADWLALKMGNDQGAVEAYQQAIDLFIGRYGDNFVLTGWGYILLGNAYDQQGSRDKAMDAMRRGTTILDQTAGTHDPRYAVAEIRYAKLLRETGQHSLAAQVKRPGRSDVAWTSSRPHVPAVRLGVAALR